ncbi:hypothetical protein JST56_00730 [Candidatus Dependentiae bacterium]|nr:hypothetical protein [Candidatus Dependentiae bacterium]
MKNFIKIMLVIVIAGFGLTVQGKDQAHPHALVVMPEQDVVAQAVETALKDKAIEAALKKLINQNGQPQAEDALKNRIALQTIQANEGILKALESIAKKFAPKKKKDPTAMGIIKDYVVSPVWETVLKPFCPFVKAYVVLVVAAAIITEAVPGGYDAAQVTSLAVYVPYSMITTLMEIAYNGFSESASADMNQSIVNILAWTGKRLLGTVVPGI